MGIFGLTNDWRARRKIAYKLYKNVFNDVNLPLTYIDSYDDHTLIETVLAFFKRGSELIYPAKYVFCNIVYSYYLNKYFGVDFYEALDSRETLFDSPYPLLYSQAKNVYDTVLNEIEGQIESLPSIVKTRHYFKMEFLIDDEDITDVCPVKFFN